MERNNQDVTSLFTLYPQNAVVKTDIYIYPLHLSNVEKRISRLFALSPTLFNSYLASWNYKMRSRYARPY